MFAPFPGLLFDPAQVGSVASVTCPPYDVIDEEARQRYLADSPYNVVRLLLAEGHDSSYRQAASLLREWRRSGVLRDDPSPRFYLYLMEYRTPDGGTAEARGVLGALDLAPDSPAIIPHEETMDRAKADRLAVLRATRANLDPIVVLSPAEDLSELLRPQGGPRLDFRLEGIRHRLYDLTDPTVTGAIRDTVKSHPVAIADGHHRFATALRYREERRAREGPGPWDAIMAYLAPVETGGLSIGPIHRLFPSLRVEPARLAERFQVAPLEEAQSPRDPGSLVVVEGEGRAWRLTPLPEPLGSLPRPWRKASPAVARHLLYPLLGVGEEEATYLPETAQVLARLAPPAGAVLMAPVPREAVAAAIEEGIRFPQKSTFFHPKPRAGLVLRSLDPALDRAGRPESGR